MGKISSIGIVAKDFVHNTLAYTFSSFIQHTSEGYDKVFSWMNSYAIPFVTNNSAFIFAGIIGFTVLTTSMFLSNVVFESKRELMRLADESKVSEQMLATFRKEMPKGNENIYVFTNKKLTKEQVQKNIHDIISLCDLHVPHFDLAKLISSLKKLNYHLSFHDHSELAIKDALLQYGWNFNLLNQASTVIDMELRETIVGAYKQMSQFEIAETMRTIKELAVKGYTTKKIETFLLEAGHDKKNLGKILASIHKVQKLHNSMKRAKEKRIERAIRLNQARPSRIAMGKYNS